MKTQSVIYFGNAMIDFRSLSRYEGIIFKKKTERRWKKKCIIISILTDQECYNEARNSKAHSNDNLRNEDSSVPGYGCEHTLNCISLFQIYFDFIYLCLATILKWI